MEEIFDEGLLALAVEHPPTMKVFISKMPSNFLIHYTCCKLGTPELIEMTIDQADTESALAAVSTPVNLEYLLREHGDIIDDDTRISICQKTILECLYESFKVIIPYLPSKVEESVIENIVFENRTRFLRHLCKSKFAYLVSEDLLICACEKGRGTIAKLISEHIAYSKN
jgi:hypothetical protein